jgi:hypothetical protein
MSLYTITRVPNRAIHEGFLFMPCVRHANNVINVRECELEELVHDDTAGVGESKERVICEACLESHGSSMNDGFVTHG